MRHGILVEGTGEESGKGSLLLWDQGWSLDVLHVDVETKHASAFGFQDLARQMNSSSVLI